MAHEFETGLTVGDKSWHGLETNTQTEVATVVEALVMAGLDWIVDLQPIYRLLSDGTPVKVPGAATVRTKDNTTLGVVGEDYRVVQNGDAFRPLQSLIDSGYMKIATAGSLRKGARVYMSCKLNAEAAEVFPGDLVEGYFLAYAGHDGRTRLSYKHTATRVVCANTLGIASRGDDSKDEGYSKSGIFFNHNSGINKQIEILQEQFGKMAGEFKSAVEMYRSMGRRQMDPVPFFEKLLGIEERRIAALAAGEEESGRGRFTMQKLLEAYETQPGKEFAAGTGWQAYNAVTYWVDHQRGRDENRKDNSLFGIGARIKNEALQLALAA